VGRADFSRTKYSPRRFVTDACQFFNDFSQSEADVSLDVLEEADSRTHEPNSICNPRPEMSWVVFASSFSGGAEWLAGITAREDIHAVTKS
jgi:hypothetical protein